MEKIKQKGFDSLSDEELSYLKENINKLEEYFNAKKMDAFSRPGSMPDGGRRL